MFRSKCAVDRVKLDVQSRQLCAHEDAVSTGTGKKKDFAIQEKLAEIFIVQCERERQKESE